MKASEERWAKGGETASRRCPADHTQRHALTYSLSHSHSHTQIHTLTLKQRRTHSEQNESTTTLVRETARGEDELDSRKKKRRSK